MASINSTNSLTIFLSSNSHWRLWGKLIALLLMLRASNSLVSPAKSCIYTIVKLLPSCRSFSDYRARQHRLTVSMKSTIDTPIVDQQDTLSSCDGREKIKVVVVGGATSVGKSAVALELCKQINGEIIIADSVQVYKNLDIGSNKPTNDEMTAIPHHLVDVVAPHEQLTTGDFCRLAGQAILDVHSRGKIPVVVGGATMWIQWLVRGTPDAPKATTESVQQAGELIHHLETARRWEDALEVLRSYDPVRAGTVSRNDWYRLRRYLEIAIDIRSGIKSAADDESVSSVRGDRTPVITSHDVDYRCFFLTEEREQLYRTIDSRCLSMLHAGLFKEVVHLLLNGHLLPHYPVAKSIGYRQVITYLSQSEIEGGNTAAFNYFLQDFGTATRNYAKRQMNWYRKEPNVLFMKIRRLHPSGLIDDAEKLVPYHAMVDEMKHWLERSQDDFEKLVERQVEVTKALEKFRSVKRGVHAQYAIENEFEEYVLQRLLSENRIRVLGMDSLNEEEKNSSWVTRLTDMGTIATDDTWSASEFDVRASEGSDSGSKLKAYQSTLFVPPAPSNRELRKNRAKVETAYHEKVQPWLNLLEEADKCRDLLHKEKPDLMKSFAEAFL